MDIRRSKAGNDFKQQSQTKSNAIEIPSISLPKGGGALRGIDEKFKVNSANGTASFSMPLPLSLTRGDFSPNLSLSYNSGSGNSPFGLGWSIDIPAIQRKTDKGIPQYKANNDEPIFQFLGFEDLTPKRQNVNGHWIPLIVEDTNYIIQQYCPRIEASFAKIERIIRKNDTSVYWKVTSPENNVQFFGLNSNSRIADPNNPDRVFSWLLDFSYDNKGNYIQYTYKLEDLANVLKSIHEANRHDGNAIFTNRYLKNIKYGNKHSWYPDNPFNPTLPEITSECFFELVLDYGEHKVPASFQSIPAYEENHFWEARPDAFSSYRSGFEIRTYRRCHTMLMFHHFKDENQFVGTNDEEVFGENYLVKSMSLEYQPSSINNSGQTEVSYLKSITETGYIRKGDKIFSKNMPPIEFEYQGLLWDTMIKVVDAESVVNTPVGFCDNYQWTDLYGEGINGILKEQAGEWFYNSNLGVHETTNKLHFTRAKSIMSKPSFNGLQSGFLSLQDLDANGQKQVVVNGGEIQGFFDITPNNKIDLFQPFKTIANVNLKDTNTRLIDLNGDGRPDIVMTEENVFSWYPSLGKKGHDQAKSTFKIDDEHLGPALVFEDQQQSVFLADMCGDGLTDIVRVRNGQICYWANKGYGTFSAKITMGNAPIFDHSDQFNPSYLQFADISGTGASDIIYTGKNNLSAYINFSGNSWSEVQQIDCSFPIHSNAKISVVDLLGTGTSCIVWSSDLPSDSNAPMRYIDLMGSKKPHVLTKYYNNLGKETTITYKSSTYYYLKDKAAGRPWITKLPFPVQVISKTVVEDKIMNTRFTEEYKYHHGYYDHQEKEFRGFGMIEKIDSEDYELWKSNNATNSLETSRVFYQAPTVTKTWYHTGAFFDRDSILSQFSSEYWFNEYNRTFLNEKIIVNEPVLNDATVVVSNKLKNVLIKEQLTAIDNREAFRACKGMMIRQEVFSLDAPLENPSKASLQKQKKPYSVTTHNCHIQLLQPTSENEYASFVVIENETLVIDYERNEHDPRVAHTINTKVDYLGNIIESASIVYPRFEPNLNLPKEIRDKQAKTHIVYNRNNYTNDIIQETVYRLRQLSEVKTYEITGLTKEKELFQATDFENILTIHSESIPYNEIFVKDKTQRRLIEHVRSLFYNETLTGALPLGILSSHGILYENYQLAYTSKLVEELFGNKMINKDALLKEEGKFIQIENDTNWWIRSGTSLFLEIENGENLTTIKNRFYAPIGYVSPFDSVTKVSYYKEYYLLLEATEDALGNRTQTQCFNFRSLLPVKTSDINGNISEVILDELGLPKAMALLGKGEEADNLQGFSEFTTVSEIEAIATYFTLSTTSELRNTAKSLLKNATTRFIYNVDRYKTSVLLLKEQRLHNPNMGSCTQIKLLPAVVGMIQREEHHTIDPSSDVVLSFDYTNGLGQVAMSKTQAEPGEALNLAIDSNCNYVLETLDTGEQMRWLGNGRTVLNNKGNPIKQYEPYFSIHPFFENDKQLVERGVTPLLYYDALGRNIKTEMPNGTFTKIKFDSWQQTSFDQNDTVKDSRWYRDRIDHRIDDALIAAGKNPSVEKVAAQKAATHHGTPSVTHLDTLGRPILDMEHNLIDKKDTNGNIVEIQSVFNHTQTYYDIEGNIQKIIDARGNTIMSYKYDMLGTRVYQKSMDAGQRWLLTNCVGEPLRTWDERNHEFQYFYDALQRPTHSIILGGDGPKPLHNVYSKIIYGESELSPNRANENELKNQNILGVPIKIYDTGGLIEISNYDFKGQPQITTRSLFKKYKEVPNWTVATLESDLENDRFVFETALDALGRIKKQTAPDLSIIFPSYNESGLLNGEAVQHQNALKPIDYIKNIRYNEKGQRSKIYYGNGICTTFTYDKENFHLIRLESKRKNGDPLQDLRYTYDAVGNIIHIEDKNIPIIFFNNQKIMGVSEYTYDALYQLKKATGRENNAAINYSHCDTWNDSSYVKEMNANDAMSMRNYA